MSLCTTARPLYTRFNNRLGTSIPEPTQLICDRTLRRGGEAASSGASPCAPRREEDGMAAAAAAHLGFRSRCRVAPTLIHFIPDSLRESAPLFLELGNASMRPGPNAHHALGQAVAAVLRVLRPRDTAWGGVAPLSRQRPSCTRFAPQERDGGIIQQMCIGSYIC